MYWLYLRLPGLEFDLRAHRKGGIKVPDTYGYIRVSSREQNEDRQVIALGKAGVSGRMVYIDKQ